jgi:hypothetical protein
MSSVVTKYLNLMDVQRTELFESLVGIEPERLWERLNPKKWAPGEHIDHTRVFNQSGRRSFQVLWKMLSPIARVRGSRPYKVQIDNVYERPNMPSKVGVFWSPQYRPERPTTAENLHRLLAVEHNKIRQFYEDKEEQILGNVYLWDPPIGWLNLIQALRVGIHHDQHHYGAVRRLLT